MNNYKWIPLGEVCEFENGDRGKNYPSKNEFQKYGIPFLNAGNIDQNRLCESGFDYITKEKYDSLRSGKAHQGDILFCLRGTIGKCAISSFEVAAIASSLVIIRAKPCIDARYLFYILTSDYFQTCMMNCDNGSVQGNMSVDFLRTIKIPLFSPEKQICIANFLTRFDNKIALNKRMMSELEETARLIYDYWFTQFDFPDENGNPYRSSGGKMTHNKTLNREIPAGWKADTLADLACYSDLSISNSNLTVDTYVSTDNMLPNRGGITLSQYLPKAGFSSKYEQYDILLSNIRPYFKKIWLADRVGGCCNDVLVIHPLRENAWAYLYWTLESEVFFAYDTAGAKGSKMPRGDKGHIMRYPLPIAPPELLERFSYKFKPLFQQHCELAHESTKLATLRNWLLPMLMNGQIHVG